MMHRAAAPQRPEVWIQLDPAGSGGLDTLPLRERSRNAGALPYPLRNHCDMHTTHFEQSLTRDHAMPSA